MSVIVKKQLSKELTEVEMKHKYTSSIHWKYNNNEKTSTHWIHNL